MFWENRWITRGLSAPSPVVRNSTGLPVGVVRYAGSSPSRARNSFSETGSGPRPGRCSTMLPARSTSSTFSIGIGLRGPTQSGWTGCVAVPLGPSVICRTLVQLIPAGAAMPDQFTPWTFGPCRSSAAGPKAPLSFR